MQERSPCRGANFALQPRGVEPPARSRRARELFDERARPRVDVIGGNTLAEAGHALPPLGGAGCYSSAGAICPNLCNELYEACVAGESARARELQFTLWRLWDLLKEQYPSSLKGGMVIMGRPVGPTSPPLPTASAERIAFIEKRLDELGIIQSEPHGW